jgi:hypothetical protein
VEAEKARRAELLYMVRRYLNADGGLSTRGVSKSLVESRRRVELVLKVGGK